MTRHRKDVGSRHSLRLRWKAAAVLWSGLGFGSLKFLLLFLLRTFSGAGEIQNLAPTFWQKSGIFWFFVCSRTLLLPSVVANAVVVIAETFQVDVANEVRGAVVGVVDVDVIVVVLVSFCEESFTLRKISSFRSAALASCGGWSDWSRVAEKYQKYLNLIILIEIIHLKNFCVYLDNSNNVIVCCSVKHLIKHLKN